VCAPQEGHYEKDMKSKVATKKWFNGKSFNNYNSGEFGAKS